MCYPYTTCKCSGKTGACDPSKSENITYTGPNLPCTGIDTNDNMTLVVQKLNDAFCNLITTTTSSSSSTTAVPTTTTTTTLPGLAIPLLRVAAPCCGDVSEKVVDLFTLGASANTFTGNDGRPYTLVSGIPVIGAPNIFSSETDKTLYSTCAQWAAINGACPTTTTTTSFTCVAYSYQVERLNCVNCNQISSGTNIINAGPLTVGRFYTDAATSIIYRIVKFNSCNAGPATSSLLDTNQKNNCAQAQCPTTTTTSSTAALTTTTSSTSVSGTTTSSTTLVATTTSSTTPPTCVSYTYTFEQRSCGNCGGIPSTGTLNNDTYITPGKWFYLPPGSLLKFVSFVGCTNAAHDIAMIDANGRTSCATVICSNGFLFSPTGRADNVASCADTSTSLVLFTNAATVAFGLRMYTNNTLTTPLQGGTAPGLWYKHGANTYRIDNTGLITATASCP